MIITMKDKYAFREDPFTEVLVLCVDAKPKSYPVVILYGNGNPGKRTIEGKARIGERTRFDLVPLRKKPLIVALQVSDNDEPYYIWSSVRSAQRSESGQTRYFKEIEEEDLF